MRITLDDGTDILVTGFREITLGGVWVGSIIDDGNEAFVVGPVVIEHDVGPAAAAEREELLSRHRGRIAIVRSMEREDHDAALRAVNAVAEHLALPLRGCGGASKGQFANP